MSSGDAVELTVRGTEPRDAGRGVVRLPGRARRTLGVLSGDTVSIEGHSATVAKVWPAGDDVAPDELRIDGTTRANAGVRVGDSVTVRQINVRDATRLVVTPVEGDLDAARAGEGVSQAVKRALFDHPVRTGERVRVDALGEAGVFRVTEVEPEQPPSSSRKRPASTSSTRPRSVRSRPRSTAASASRTRTSGGWATNSNRSASSSNSRSRTPTSSVDSVSTRRRVSSSMARPAPGRPASPKRSRTKPMRPSSPSRAPS